MGPHTRGSPRAPGVLKDQAALRTGHSHHRRSKPTRPCSGRNAANQRKCGALTHNNASIPAERRSSVNACERKHRHRQWMTQPAPFEPYSFSGFPVVKANDYSWSDFLYFFVLRSPSRWLKANTVPSNAFCGRKTCDAFRPGVLIAISVNAQFDQKDRKPVAPPHDKCVSATAGHRIREPDSYQPSTSAGPQCKGRPPPE